jgi:hypothetical protein
MDFAGGVISSISDTFAIATTDTRTISKHPYDSAPIQSGYTTPGYYGSSTSLYEFLVLKWEFSNTL